jgi:hypothetical protein
VSIICLIDVTDKIVSNRITVTGRRGLHRSDGAGGCHSDGAGGRRSDGAGGVAVTGRGAGVTVMARGGVTVMGRGGVAVTGRWAGVCNDVPPIIMLDFSNTVTVHRYNTV